jgi:hypothetical protein
LCLSKDEFQAVLKHLGVQSGNLWVNNNSNATMHTFENEDGSGTTCVVCVKDYAERDAVEIAGILVHEAVHIWQGWCRNLGETTPGEEQEAYAIQFIADTLMREFARRLK